MEKPLGTDWHQLVVCGEVISATALQTKQTGQKICTFTVNVHEIWQSRDGRSGERNHHYKAMAFGRNAENADKYLNRGSRVILVGKPTAQTSIDEYGKAHGVQAIIVQNMHFIGSVDSIDQSGTQQQRFM